GGPDPDRRSFCAVSATGGGIRPDPQDSSSESPPRYSGADPFTGCGVVQTSPLWGGRLLRRMLNRRPHRTRASGETMSLPIRFVAARGPLAVDRSVRGGPLRRSTVPSDLVRPSVVAAAALLLAGC